MSRPINENREVSFIPTGYSDNTFDSKYYQNLNNGLNPHNGTNNYARFRMYSTNYHIFYDFSVTGIPDYATINSVTCQVKGYVNNESYYATLRLYSGDTGKGSAFRVEGTSNTNVDTLSGTSVVGTWTVEELSNARLYINTGRGRTNSQAAYYYFFGATLTISYNISGTEYEVSVENISSNVTTDPSTSQYVFQGETQQVHFYNIESLDDVEISDNDTDIKSLLVHNAPGDHDINLIPSELVDSNGTVSNVSNGLTDHTSNTYAECFGQSSNFLLYKFDTSSILLPDDAQNITVSCLAKVEHTHGSTEYGSVQLYHGASEKGNSSSFRAAEVVDMDCGTWTVEELNDIRIRIGNTYTGGTTSYRTRFYGATLTITYTTAEDSYVYTISNISADHEILVDDAFTGPRYLVTATSNYSEATITPDERNVPEGRNITFTITINNLYEIVVTDNGSDVTNSLVGSNGTYTYTISTVTRPHTVLVDEQLSYSITTSSTYSGATVSAPSKVYLGQNATVTVTVDDFSVIKIFDDDTDITSSFTGSGTTYTYTFTNVQANHNISIIEKGKINVTCVSNVEGVTLNPSGVTAVNENNSFTVSIDGQLTSDMVLTDNGVDVTSQIRTVQTTLSDSKSTVLGQYTLVSGGFNTGESWFSGRPGNGHNTTNTTTSSYYASSSSSNAIFTYKLSFSNIPSNAVVTKLYVLVNAHPESTTNNSEYMCFQLRSGNTELSNEFNFKDTGTTSNTTQTIEATTLPTISQLSNLVLYCRLGYYGGALNGATCYVEYNYTDTVTGYTIASVTEPHDIVLSKVFIPEDEDPELVYHSLTISSINATTTPESGTTRVVEGTTQTITIYPSDPLLTLATDNGVDITDSLVHHGQTIPDPVVSSVSGASYGFTLNNSTGYYVSQNAGQNNSAALCRVTFNLPVRCLITIQYINFAEANYDYGIFGNIDTALGTTSTADTNAYRVLSASSDNTSTAKTLTYEIESGSHFIDIKFRKDTYTGENNDNLQWKILSIEPLEANEYYEYTISNISDDHSLVFIFGDVTYYFITSTGTSCKLFPAGSMVQLPGDNYKLTIVPDNISDDVTITDNNSNVTDELQRVETEVTKDGQTITVVNYVYNISNVQETHDIVVSCLSNKLLYIKISGSWIEARRVYVKTNGRWSETQDYTSVFRQNQIYVRGS